MIFVFLFFVPKFSVFLTHDSYTVRRHSEKCSSHWAANDYHLRDVLRRPIRLQEML